MAVGWAQAGSSDAEPAVWRTRDAGATWEPIPPEKIPPGGSRADHMERVIAWSGRLLATGIEQNGAGGIAPRLWLSIGEDEWQYSPTGIDAWALSDVASLVSGEAFLAGATNDLQGAIWRAESGGPWERVSDPELATLQWAQALKAGSTGLVLLGADQASDQAMQSANAPALWGSPDGVHWVQTLRLEGHAATWSAAVSTPDQWLVYGTTGDPPERRQVVWTAIPRCATGGAICPSG